MLRELSNTIWMYFGIVTVVFTLVAALFEFNYIISSAIILGLMLANVTIYITLRLIIHYVGDLTPNKKEEDYYVD